jgi:hypothetical protein
MPLTPKQFRQVALSFPETKEHSHMHHPDFRVAGKNLRHPRLPRQILGHGQTNARTTSRTNARRTKSLRPSGRRLGPQRQHHSPPEVRQESNDPPSPRSRLAQHRPQKFVGKIRIFRRLSGQGDRDPNRHSEGSRPTFFFPIRSCLPRGFSGANGSACAERNLSFFRGVAGGFLSLDIA